jgi:NAD(P)-dependent dehydrogenase (short-subunit alcohol dehydrogenase family)/aryl carrier-like protein
MLLQTQPAAPETKATPERWTYRLAWLPQPLKAGHDNPKRLAVFGSASLAQDLSAKGFDVEAFSVPRDRNGWERALAFCKDRDVLFAPEPAQRPIDAANALQETLQQASTLLEAQACLNPIVRPRLWCVTRNGVRVSSADPLPAPDHAGLLAWARGIANERRGMLQGIVDLGGDILATALLSVLSRTSPTMTALRDGTCFEPRICPTEVQIVSTYAGVSAVDPNDLWLITGAGGVLGRAMAMDLVRRGARRIAILIRGPISGLLHAAIDQITNAGCRVFTVKADCADEAGLGAALADLYRRAGCPVHHVIHCAGKLDAVASQDVMADDIARILHGKVRGAMILMRLLAYSPLKSCLFMGSASAVFSPPGHSVYAAANGFLEAFSEAIREAGQPCTTVHWGVWETAGASDAVEQFRALGLPLIPINKGLELAHRLSAAGENGTIVMPGARAEWESIVARWMGLPLLDACDLPIDGQLIGDLASMLRAEAAAIMHLPVERLDPNRSLVAQGLDSLMAIGLKGRIETLSGASLGVSAIMTAEGLGALVSAVENGKVSYGPTGQNVPRRETISL